ncbi:hypothetical protein SAMN06296036_1351, partial [Pseudobacteriovorax antillogorgiicola]
GNQKPAANRWLDGRTCIRQEEKKVTDAPPGLIMLLSPEGFQKINFPLIA